MFSRKQIMVRILETLLLNRLSEESFINMFFFHGTLAMLIALHKKTSKRPLGSAYDVRPAV